jgi:iron complex outermembrane receptor protein
VHDVPLSIATLNSEQFENIFSGGEDIIALALRVLACMSKHLTVE